MQKSIKTKYELGLVDIKNCNTKSSDEFSEDAAFSSESDLDEPTNTIISKPRLKKTDSPIIPKRNTKANINDLNLLLNSNEKGSRKLHVGNLKLETTEADLRVAFAR